jgi:hypothetical protein
MSDILTTDTEDGLGDDGDTVLRLHEALLRHVVSLYRQPRGQSPEHVGTALLLRAHGCDFLVSAAHVLSDPSALFLYSETSTKRRLNGTLTRTKPLDGDKSDRVDLATLMLQPPGLPPYPDVDKEGGDADQLMGRESPFLEDDFFLVTGMPASRSKANPHTYQIKVEAFSLLSSRAPASTYEALRLSENLHLALVLDRTKSVNLDGSARVFPDPHGMSGSPVWRLPSEKNGLHLPQLVGILTEFHRAEKVLIATRVRQVARQMAGLIAERHRGAQ